MSRSVFILLILLVLWILLGLFLWNWNLGGDSSDSEPCVVSWKLKDGSTTITQSDATINFGKSNATVQKMDDELKTSINKIADYLKGNSKKNMTVVGYYDQDESPTKGTLRDLALARANVVKAMFTKNGVSPNQLAIIPMVYDEENHSNSDCLDGDMLNRGVSFSIGRMKGSE